MFTIKGVYAMKLYPDGSISRTKKAFQTTLNSEQGVMAFLDEQKPFVEVKITEVGTKKDMTKYFLGQVMDKKEGTVPMQCTVTRPQIILHFVWGDFVVNANKVDGYRIIRRQLL